MVAVFDSFAVEAQVLRDQGLSVTVILTLLQAGKLTYWKVYDCTWKAYFT